MTTAFMDGLPAAVRDLGAVQLLDLPADERADRLTDALCAFYDFLAGDDDSDEDEDALPHPDHPLMLESAIAAEMNVALDGWLGVTVPIESLLLDGLSPRSLAERLLVELAAGGVRRGGPLVPPLLPDPGSRQESFPLSDIQQAYWIGRDPMFELGDVSALLYVELRVRDFDVQRAERALELVVTRHDMLRSVVSRAGTQQVLPAIDVPRIDVTDLRHLDVEARATAVAAARRRLTGRRTRPELPEPFEIQLLQLDDAHACLMMSVDMVKLDAWSVQLLLAEWFQVYDDPATVLPPLELTFRDYVRWTGEVRESAAFEAAKAYWVDRLPSLPPAPELPLVTSLDEVARPTFAARSARLPQDRWAVLKERAAAEGLTPSMLLCAAYTEVLAAWSRHRRFTVSVAGGRPPAHTDLPRVLGPFARPTMLEVDLTAETSFRERARAVQRQFSRDMEHRQFGGLDVLRALAASRGRTRATMPVIFTSVLPQGGEGGLPRPEWLEADPYVVWGMPQLLLENQMLEVDGDLMITWVNVEEAFAPGVVEAMFAAYQDLLERAVVDQDLWSGELSTLLPTDQAGRRESVNATAAPVPQGLLHDPFAAQVAARPDAPAVLSDRRNLSYAELDRQADVVAAALMRRGVSRGELVGVCMDRGWEQIAAVLGVLRAGAAYLPLDPELPAMRLEHLLERGLVNVTLVQPEVRDRVAWPQAGERLVVRYEDRGPEERPNVRVAPDDLAYVIFTSGSTGVPKGVMIEHRSAANTVLDIIGRFDIGVDDRVLALSSLNFDLSVQDIFGTLAAGAAIVLPDAGTGPDVAHWWKLLDSRSVTVWNSVPALMQVLLDHPHRPETSGAGGSLRLVMLSGDWIPVGLPGRVREAFPSARVISLGGATEAAIWSVFHPVTEEDAGRRSVPYGRPLTNQRLHVLDDRLEFRPDLVAGDLYIAGEGLARGYWRDPERTDAAFLTHPGTGERLYRTGDLARYLPSGDLEFLGREDAQVKINGHRIELGEIETALEAHPAVRSAVASAHGDMATGRSLGAHVVLHDKSITPAALQDFIAQRIPAYAVPSHIAVLDELPLTPNGKVDRAALDRPGPEAVAEVAPPAFDSPVAPVLASILEELLERPVGLNDDIYTLGANSLVAVQLVARAEDVGIRLCAADVLANPSAALLAVASQVGPDMTGAM
ncbi:amino acid adenylation domain-containing protein [Modestobacter sp. I12A-02628]|uniref:Phenyloxazoline synthase MbtB n=1 Tax=Goekera deserti TaxID=2497753 RepID=A0A7K3WCX3_9ACTN|nr:non-ribosomal peptide synthetase [Goekera deserti]MPQ96927.1 amino acid adenylation domain-containing protein [Goekera deserti]NDI46759.1 amino acid adenylation domain-containing protein [Goekera deserti]NEL54328.1 amino acid adenylation domain-containing protein [Goekera deserti]